MTIYTAPKVSPVPTVLPLATLSLLAAFASWTLFAILGVRIKDTLVLDEFAFGVLMAVPMLLAGAVSLPLGVLSERWGSRRVMISCLLGLLPFLVWLAIAESYLEYLLVGCGLGLTGGLFGAGVRYVARYSSPTRRGLALGCYGAGMMGAGINFIVVPQMEIAFGWHLAPFFNGLMLILAAFLLFIFGEDDCDLRQNPRSSFRNALELVFDLRLWRICLYYSFVFGGYLALAFWLPDYLHAHYDVPLAEAGLLSLFFTVPGAVAQIPGGYLADRTRARRLNFWVCWISLACLFILSYPPTSLVVQGIHGEIAMTLTTSLPLFLVLVCILGTAMGFGAGSTLRLLVSQYPLRIGVAGGALVASGGFTGFFLPVLFGIGNTWAGLRSSAFMILFGLLVVCMLFMALSNRSRPPCSNNSAGHPDHSWI
ncbi:MFS transporter [Marinobacteraceae bacterium S3BR75-40.1]